MRAYDAERRQYRIFCTGELQNCAANSAHNLQTWRPTFHAQGTSAPDKPRNLFQILLNQTEIRLYLPCTHRFGTANGQRPFAVPNQSENGKYNHISV